MRQVWLFPVVLFTGVAAGLANDEVQVLDAKLHHLRIKGPREWTEFAEQPEAERLELTFNSRRNASPLTLRLRQQDVKQTWNVTLNQRPLGQLVRDENDMVVYFIVPPSALNEGINVLRVEQDVRRQKVSDDIRVGQVQLDSRPRSTVLNESVLEVEVVDAAGGRHLPARITIVDHDGALQTTGAKSDLQLAVRPGIVYTSTGKARIGLPTGTYRVYAGRGFEYSIQSANVSLTAGQTAVKTLSISREVPTAGYVSCDTHVHTLTHSGHGDATVEERMITLAGEGIELPIATDHNVHIDHTPFADKLNVRRYFTPVIGNEVTTPVGHFNVFPVRAGAPIPNFKLTEWDAILSGIYRTPHVKVAILNHPRDLHSGVRPFGPKNFNAVVGENVRGWAMRFNAMEVVNSGATQSDPMRLLHDWMALLNRGRRVTPVGSSDSHDVGRHFVGQGRTYIRCDDRDPSNIDVEQAVGNLVQGRVMVSYGLLTEIQVDGSYGSGEMVPAVDDQIRVDVKVLGPHWTRASKVTLFANGQEIRTVEIAKDAGQNLPLGLKWRGTWNVPRFRHDVHLVAIATGPGVEGLYWRTARPYQPTSPQCDLRVLGCSGAVWLDVDGDGRPTPAHDYAQRLVAEAGGDLPKLLERLADYDQSVSVQAAHLYQARSATLLTAQSQAALRTAAQPIQDAFRRYLNAWRENQMSAVK